MPQVAVLTLLQSRYSPGVEGMWLVVSAWMRKRVEAGGAVRTGCRWSRMLCTVKIELLGLMLLSKAAVGCTAAAWWACGLGPGAVGMRHVRLCALRLWRIARSGLGVGRTSLLFQLSSV